MSISARSRARDPLEYVLSLKVKESWNRSRVFVNWANEFGSMKIWVCPSLYAPLDGVRDAQFEQQCRHLVLATTKVYPASESFISNLVMEGLK